ncbi:executer 1 [Asimina triloba]
MAVASAPPLHPFNRSLLDFSARKEASPNPNPTSSAFTFQKPLTKSVRTSILSCRCSSATPTTSSEWDWSRWNQHFSDIDHADNFSSVLKVARFVLFPQIISVLPRYGFCCFP